MEKQDRQFLSKVVKLSLIFLLSLFYQSAHAEDWITEEVLKQLSEVRQELKSLKEEIRSLKETIAKPTSAKADKNLVLEIANSPTLGKSSATVAIVEFSDYQCPYCRRHYKQTMPDLIKKYVDTGKVKYVMKQFPLGFHQKARGASIAALCVDKLKPGMYFKAHELIFDKKISMDESGYLLMANQLKVGTDKFKKCLLDPKVANTVEKNLNQGQSVGVSGTPAFLIGQVKDGKLVNGRLLSGARPLSSFSYTLDQLL